MAKKFVPTQKVEKYTAYPSPYGSHASMVDEEATKQLNQSGKVVCKDGSGHYITDRTQLDSGLADPHRNAEAEWRNGQLTKNGLPGFVKVATAA